MRLALFWIVCALTLGSASALASGSEPRKPLTRSPAKPSPMKPAPPPVALEPEELDAERLAVAPHVLQGEAQCEFNERIHLNAHPTLMGRFLLRHRGKDYVMTPHPTTTGVVRLEDRHQGMVWLQVPVKSMLMDSRKGQRLADACLHPAQIAESLSAQGAGVSPQP